MGIIGDGFKPRTRFFHYVFAEPDCEAIQDMVSVAKEAVGKDIRVCGSCLSDLSVISKYGSSNAFAFGAGRDFSLKGGAHQPNEFMECDRLVEYAKIIGSYILKTLGE
jgi:acetylornithine deacetylase/succinyl-diaminopimelate desuccinylase-like protein